MPSSLHFLNPALRRAALAALLFVGGRARANDAALDLTFAPRETPTGFISEEGVRALVVQTDGKVVIGGDFQGSPGNLARLLPTGRIDTTFKSTGINSRVEALANLPDGKVLVGGFFSSVGGVARDAIARLNADGSTDAAFGPAGTYTRPGSNIDVTAIAVQPDGKVLIGGAFRTTLANGTTRDNLMRLNADGTADPGFTPAESANLVHVSALTVQADGKVLVGNTGGHLLARLNADGSADPGFAPSIINGANFGRPTDTIHSMVVLPDGRIIAGGRFVAVAPGNQSRASLAIFNADGSLDLGFDAKINDYSAIYGLAQQADGKIVIGGTLANLTGTAIHSVERLNLDGSLDASFDDGATSFDESGRLATIYAVALQTDGKALIVGNLDEYGGQPRAGVARLGGNGTPPPPDKKLADLSGSMAGVKAGPNAKGTRLKVSGTLTVKNSGVKPAKNVLAAAYLSADQTFSASADRLIGTVALADAGFPKIGKNGKQVTLPVLFKGKLSDLGPTSGKYVLVVLDPQNAIEENDETNNVALTQQLP